MPDAPEPIKSLIAASSGYGKSGSVWSLVAAGFTVKILDADRGTKIIRSALAAVGKASLFDAKVDVQTFTNKLKGNIEGYPAPNGKPKAWPNALAALDKWPTGGSVYEWGPETVLVVDSLTLFGRHALLYAQYQEQKAGRKPEIQHYGTAMAQLEGLMALLYSEDVRCHVLVLTHVKNEHTKGGEYIGSFPSSLGKGLNEVIPRYFNNILSISMSGMGPGAKRYLSTWPTSNQVATRCEELGAKEKYLLAEGVVPKPGLAEFFADCGFPGPGGTK